MAFSSVSVLLLLVASGCASVPVEVVELSYVQGRDQAAIHASYRALIHAHFDDLRKQRLAYVEDIYAPKYIEKWVEKGRLADLALGKAVWSREKKDFVAPPPGHERDQLLSSVTNWSKAAIKRIESKKSELLEPLDQDEAALLTSVDDAFAQLALANATITAHLNSLKQVENVQDDALKALSIKDLRDKLNGELAAASSKAETALQELRRADDKVSDLVDRAAQADASP